MQISFTQINNVANHPSSFKWLAYSSTIIVFEIFGDYLSTGDLLVYGGIIVLQGMKLLPLRCDACSGSHLSQEQLDVASACYVVTYTRARESQAKYREVSECLLVNSIMSQPCLHAP